MYNYELNRSLVQISSEDLLTVTLTIDASIVLPIPSIIQQIDSIIDGIESTIDSKNR